MSIKLNDFILGAPWVRIGCTNLKSERGVKSAECLNIVRRNNKMIKGRCGIHEQNRDAVIT
jgi:hypothetical protein